MVVRDACFLETITTKRDGVIAKGSCAEKVAAFGADRVAIPLLGGAHPAEHRCVHASARDGVTDPGSPNAIGETSAAIDERKILTRPRCLGQQIAREHAAVVDGLQFVWKLARWNDARGVVDIRKEVVGLRQLHVEV